MASIGSPYRLRWVRVTSAVIGICTLSTAALFGFIIAGASLNVESAADAQAIARSGTIAIALAVVGLAAGVMWFLFRNRK
jgi:hypothetical protein